MSEKSVNSIGVEIMTNEQLVTYIQQGDKHGMAIIKRRE